MKLEESRWYKNATLKVLRIVLNKIFAIIGLILDPRYVVGFAMFLTPFPN